MVKPSQKSIDLINDIFVQGDTRYGDYWNAHMVASFLDNKGIEIEKILITNKEEPSKEELRRIGGPQKYYKFIGKQLLEAKGYQITGFEIPFRGGRADILAENPSKRDIIAVECCSCRITKAIDYLGWKNTTLWILSLGETCLDEEPLPLYVIKRGPKWDICLEMYEKAIRQLFKKVEKVTNI